MCLIGETGCVWCKGIRGGDEGEQHHKAEEQEDEKDVDAEGADQYNETAQAPAKTECQSRMTWIEEVDDGREHTWRYCGTPAMTGTVRHWHRLVQQLKGMPT